MTIAAMAVSPILAQQADSTKTKEEQPVEEISDEAVAEEPAVEEPAAVEPAALTEEEEVDQAIEEATGEVWIDEALEGEEALEEEALGPLVEESLVEESLVDESLVDEYDGGKPKHREVQTLMSGGGGYGAISVGYTQVNNLNALMMGARAEWLVGHGFGLGIAGVGFTSDFTPVNSDYYALSGGYGGLVLEPIIMGWLPVHIALPVVIGGGGLASYATNADPWDYDNIDPTFGEYAVFFVGEIGLEVEFNLVKFFRLTLFGNYRFTSNLEMKPMYGLEEVSPYVVGPHALNGWSTGVRFKFGSF